MSDDENEGPDPEQIAEMGEVIARRVKMAITAMDVMVEHSDEKIVKALLNKVMALVEQEKATIANANVMVAFLVDALCEQAPDAEIHRTAMILMIQRVGELPNREKDKDLH